MYHIGANIQLLIEYFHRECAYVFFTSWFACMWVAAFQRRSKRFLFVGTEVTPSWFCKMVYWWSLVSIVVITPRVVRFARKFSFAVGIMFCYQALMYRCYISCTWTAVISFSYISVWSVVRSNCMVFHLWTAAGCASAADRLVYREMNDDSLVRDFRPRFAVQCSWLNCPWLNWCDRWSVIYRRWFDQTCFALRCT